MSEGKRPGGLTALAVINFVLGGFYSLGVLGMVAMFAMMNVTTTDAELNEAQREVAKAWAEVGSTVMYTAFAILLVQTVLLIMSGVGYLKQKRFLGRTLGNVMALVAIGSSVIEIAMVPEKANGGFSMWTVIGLVYPVLTLMLLNTTFKEDFVH